MKERYAWADSDGDTVILETSNHHTGDNRIYFEAQGRGVASEIGVFITPKQWAEIKAAGDQLLGLSTNPQPPESTSVHLMPNAGVRIDPGNREMLRSLSNRRLQVGCYQVAVAEARKLHAFIGQHLAYTEHTRQARIAELKAELAALEAE